MGPDGGREGKGATVRTTGSVGGGTGPAGGAAHLPVSRRPPLCVGGWALPWAEESEWGSGVGLEASVHRVGSCPLAAVGGVEAKLPPLQWRHQLSGATSPAARAPGSGRGRGPRGQGAGPQVRVPPAQLSRGPHLPDPHKHRSKCLSYARGCGWREGSRPAGLSGPGRFPQDPCTRGAGCRDQPTLMKVTKPP